MTKKMFFPIVAIVSIITIVAGCSPLPQDENSPTQVAATDPTVTITKIINSSYFFPSSYEGGQISAAAALDVYFEHASVGDCIVGTSYGTSGLELLKSSDARYTCGRTTFSKDQAVAMTDPDAAWFDLNDGLGDNYRGNPGASAKISYFQASCGVVASHVDVAMFKFCWIDPDASFSSAKSAMESLEAAYPSVTFVWWTMPITTADYGERDPGDKARRQA